MDKLKTVLLHGLMIVVLAYNLLLFFVMHEQAQAFINMVLALIAYVYGLMTSDNDDNDDDNDDDGDDEEDEDGVLETVTEEMYSI